jgi:geranylgeranyl pyrophosphate synthase
MKTRGENVEIDPDEAMKRLQKLFKERGSKALEMARKEMLQKKIECKEAREAIKYFMTEYWNDLARPTLLSLVCEAVGGDPELTTPIAVPLILISGALDIHDDIIDRSRYKNKRLTVYGKFGKEIALLIGDALLFRGFALLHELINKGIPSRSVFMINSIIQEAFFELGDAEALELHFRGRVDVSPEEYLLVIRKKAADVEAHTRIGALLGGAPSKEIELLGEYGRLLGMMIILRDDFVDIFDFEESRHRVKAECLPLPVIYALQNTKVRIELSSILFKKTLTVKDAHTILNMVYKVGAIKRLEKLVQGLAEDAYSKLKVLGNRGKNLQLLVDATLPKVLIDKERDLAPPPISRGKL